MQNEIVVSAKLMPCVCAQWDPLSDLCCANITRGLQERWDSLPQLSNVSVFIKSYHTLYSKYLAYMRHLNSPFQVRMLVSKHFVSPPDLWVRTSLGGCKQDLADSREHLFSSDNRHGSPVFTIGSVGCREQLSVTGSFRLAKPRMLSQAYLIHLSDQICICKDVICLCQLVPQHVHPWGL